MCPPMAPSQTRPWFQASGGLVTWLLWWFCSSIKTLPTLVLFYIISQLSHHEMEIPGGGVWYAYHAYHTFFSHFLARHIQISGVFVATKPLVFRPFQLQAHQEHRLTTRRPGTEGGNRPATAAHCATLQRCLRRFIASEAKNWMNLPDPKEIPRFK
jgi:hypothetical protein